VRIAAGTENSAKLEALRRVAGDFYDDLDIESFDVETGIDQPVGVEETREAAKIRAEEAHERGGADLGVGIEGYIENIGGEYFLSNWSVVYDGEAYYEGGSGRARLPEGMQDRLPKEELGEVIVDEMGEDLRERKGAMGVITGDRVGRPKTTERGLVYAFSDLEG
jgi:inosine/xanthosine triphosphatase